MYKMLRNMLFLLDPELSHELSIDMMGAAERLKLISLLPSKVAGSPKTIMGLEFKNAVGMAAGMDKNGDCYNTLGRLGFGFVEIGTVTPLPQAGNDKPRLFRLREQEAIINRMGFNNKGVDYLVERVKRRSYDGILGINIGKNKVTPEENALDDYIACMDKVYDHADYIAINISSPNTPGLRSLQYGDALDSLIKGIDQRRVQLADKFGKRVPIAVKVAPDNDDDTFKEIADTLLRHNMDAVIATNTTLSREGVESHMHANEAGGLSGLPIKDKSTAAIRTLKAIVGDDLPIIGVGGIASAADAREKVDAGADLVQIYSAFIYEGPGLIKEIAKAL